MVIVSQRYLFSKKNISELAPDDRGVYGLYDNRGQLIYYGKANLTTIRARLMSHFNGNEGKCTAEAFYFNFELNDSPDEREIQLLEDHQTLTGQLPKCNERIG